LRRSAGARFADNRSHHAAVAGRDEHLGKLRAGLHRVQQAEGGPDAEGSSHEAGHEAWPAEVAATVCDAARAGGELDEVY